MLRRNGKLYFGHTFEMFIQVTKTYLGCPRRWLLLLMQPYWKPSLDWKFEYGQTDVPSKLYVLESFHMLRVGPNTTHYWSLQDCWQCLVETWTQQSGQQWPGKWKWFQGWWSAILRWFGEAEPSDDTENVVQKVCTLSMKVTGESRSLVGSVKNTELFCIPVSWLISMARGLLPEDHSEAPERM